MSGSGKSLHGGRRAGAGRKTSAQPTLWMQVAIQATEVEAALLRGLTPAQRRDRLITIVDSMPAPSSQMSSRDNTDESLVLDAERFSVEPVETQLTSQSTYTNSAGANIPRRPCNIRVQLTEPGDRATILALSTDERRERLLEGLI